MSEQEVTAEHLEKMLQGEPRDFESEGGAYRLLQCYLEGRDPENLRSLILSDDSDVNRVAAFIASELGARASTLVSDIVVLLQRSEDVRTRLASLEVLAVCARGSTAVEYWHVIAALNDKDSRLATLMTPLVARATREQLQAVMNADRQRYPLSNVDLIGLSVLSGEIPASELTTISDEDRRLVDQYRSATAERIRTSVKHSNS